MSRMIDKYWEPPIKKPTMPVVTKSAKVKAFQIYCDTQIGVNSWLMDNPDVEVMDFKMSMNDDGELIAVIYKVELEGTRNEQRN